MTLRFFYELVPKQTEHALKTIINTLHISYIILLQENNFFINKNLFFKKKAYIAHNNL